jgi:hypothetical protein
LGLTHQPSELLERETRLGRLLAGRAGSRRIDELHTAGLLTDEMWTGLREDYQQVRDEVVNELHQLFVEHGQLERQMVLQARREALRAERAALGDALRRGLITEETYGGLRNDTDNRLAALDLIELDTHQEGQSSDKR